MSTVYVESSELAAEVRLLIQSISRRDQDLARRLKRASDEVPVHIAEGMCATGRSKRAEYGAAVASARETLACLRAAEGVGLLAQSSSDLRQRVQALLDRILASLA